MDNKLRRHIIDYDSKTGEILLEKEYDVKPKLIMSNTRRKFIKSFIESSPEYSIDAYLGYFFKITKFLEQNTNRVVNRKSGKWLENQPMINADLEELLEISRTTLHRFISESKTKGYIRKVANEKDYAYYVNPIYCCNGNGVSPELYLIFEGDEKLEANISELDRIVIRDYLGLLKRKEHINENR